MLFEVLKTHFAEVIGRNGGFFLEVTGHQLAEEGKNILLNFPVVNILEGDDIECTAVKVDGGFKDFVRIAADMDKFGARKELKNMRKL